MRENCGKTGWRWAIPGVALLLVPSAAAGDSLGFPVARVDRDWPLERRAFVEVADASPFAIPGLRSSGVRGGWSDQWLLAGAEAVTLGSDVGRASRIGAIIGCPMAGLVLRVDAHRYAVDGEAWHRMTGGAVASVRVTRNVRAYAALRDIPLATDSPLTTEVMIGTSLEAGAADVRASVTLPSFGEPAVTVSMRLGVVDAIALGVSYDELTESIAWDVTLRRASMAIEAGVRTHTVLAPTAAVSVRWER